MCTRDAPCLGVLRQIVRASTFIVEQCGSAHTFRREVPWQGGIPVPAPTDTCRVCGRIFKVLNRADVGAEVCYRYACQREARLPGGR